MAALQTMTTRHLRSHTTSALRWRKRGSPRALAFRWRKKSRVSSDHQPPTSHARTTRRDLQNRPDSSGYRLSFLALVVAKDAPSTVVLLGRGAPFRRRGHHGGVKGETKFGQIQVWPKLGQDQVWPHQVWPRPSLAKTKFGQTKFGQVWPNSFWKVTTCHMTKMLNFESELGKREKQQKLNKEEKLVACAGKKDQNAKWKTRKETY